MEKYKVLDAGDVCFFCFKLLSSRGEEDEGQDLNFSTNKFSLKGLARFLQIDLCKFSSDSFNESFNRNEGENLLVHLCENCLTVIRDFNDLYVMQEEMKILMKHSISKILDKMEGASKEPGVLMELTKRLAQVQEEHEIMEGLRQRIMLKCKRKLRASVPRVILSRLSSPPSATEGDSMELNPEEESKPPPTCSSPVIDAPDELKPPKCNQTYQNESVSSSFKASDNNDVNVMPMEVATFPNSESQPSSTPQIPELQHPELKTTSLKTVQKCSYCNKLFSSNWKRSISHHLVSRHPEHYLPNFYKFYQGPYDKFLEIVDAELLRLVEDNKCVVCLKKYQIKLILVRQRYLKVHVMESHSKQVEENIMFSQNCSNSEASTSTLESGKGESCDDINLGVINERISCRYCGWKLPVSKMWGHQSQCHKREKVPGREQNDTGKCFSCGRLFLLQELGRHERSCVGLKISMNMKVQEIPMTWTIASESESENYGREVMMMESTRTFASEEEPNIVQVDLPSFTTQPVALPRLIQQELPPSWIHHHSSPNMVVQYPPPSIQRDELPSMTQHIHPPEMIQRDFPPSTIQQHPLSNIILQDPPPSMIYLSSTGEPVIDKVRRPSLASPTCPHCKKVLHKNYELHMFTQHKEQYFLHLKKDNVSETQFKDIVDYLIFKDFIKNLNCTLCNKRNTTTNGESQLLEVKQHLFHEHREMLEQKLEEIQNVPGINAQLAESNYACSCGSFFQTKKGLQRHECSCDVYLALEGMPIVCPESKRKVEESDCSSAEMSLKQDAQDIRMTLMNLCESEMGEEEAINMELSVGMNESMIIQEDPLGESGSSLWTR